MRVAEHGALDKPISARKPKRSDPIDRDRLRISLDAVLMLDALTRCWGCLFEEGCEVKNVCKYDGGENAAEAGL